MNSVSALGALKADVDALASAHEGTALAALPAWGSLTILLILLHFETKYQVALSGAQVRACVTVGDLLKLIPPRS